jgi:hypothetical protein
MGLIGQGYNFGGFGDDSGGEAAPTNLLEINDGGDFLEINDGGDVLEIAD